ncbi:hypothetical protein HMPREF3204_00534 [Gardnerella pickettii]|nr:hypothetical protein HMPREF3204_00534 [Gardnerella pickettii]
MKARCAFNASEDVRALRPRERCAERLNCTRIDLHERLKRSAHILRRLSDL